MELNFNTLILALSKINKLGRKRIFKILSKIENLENFSFEETFKFLDIEKRISLNEFKNFYGNSIIELNKIKKSKIDIFNIFENDQISFFKNKSFFNNEYESIEFPNQLFVLNKSNLKLKNYKNIFTIIGTRNNSNESKLITQKIVNYLVKKNSIIVSGLAKGIDAIAHQKVIDLDGITIAILANGLDTIYPAENRDLAKKIIKNGMLVSEYPFGLKAEKFRLIERDRIQAMIANDVVLIESKIDGGSMHAIKWAKKLNKRIWCFKINSSGNMDLIDNYKKCISFKNLEEFIEKYNYNVSNK
jgi:DNA processing protein